MIEKCSFYCCCCTQPLYLVNLGVMHTVWSSADSFLESYYNPRPEDDPTVGITNCLKAMMASIKKAEN